ncbi:MAG: hypothetical protein MUC35_05970 [Candidatus Margulisbacteria bacterium]|jgi:hypothetical protein|nr:hypothetical protein [Candidatus Margulisiibacteriota bacterium]
MSMLRAEESLKSKYGIDLSGGGLSLNSLGDNVSQALGLGNDGSGTAGAGAKLDAIMPAAHEVKSYMAGLGGLPLPGMLVQNTVV